MFELERFQLTSYPRQWWQESSPCFSKDIFIILNLLLLTVFAAQFLFKVILQLHGRKHRSIGEDEQHCLSGKAIPGSVRVNKSYQASKWCCSVVLACQILELIFFPSNVFEVQCELLILVLSESMKGLSSIVVLASIFNFQRKRTIKMPWTVRLLCLSIFLQTTISLVFKLHFILSHKLILGTGDCLNIIALFSCACLTAIIIRGHTGISVTSGSVAEPLLIGSAEKQTEIKRQCPYGIASLTQLVTFSWINPLFSIGIKKPLEQHEVPDIDVKDSAEFLSHSFHECLERVKEKHGWKTSSVYRAMFLFIWKKAAINASFAMVSAASSYVGPSLINDLVSFLGGKGSHRLQNGYILALIFLSAKFVETVAQRQWIFGARQLGLRLRAALISHIYQKGLHLSNQSRQSHTSGELINYMSVDIQRITDIMWFANIIWMLPIQIFLAINVLQRNLGFGALAGLAATFFIMALNIPLTQKQKDYQSKIMEAKDDRMKSTTEVLRSMKILKLQAWDMQYLHKLENLRTTECNWLWKSLRLQAITAFIFWGSPTFISGITFGVCILMGIPLTAGRVLSALATFRMLQEPIFNLPDLLSALAQAKVSADRIASYLTAVRRGALAPVIITAQSFFQILQVASNYWMAWASPPTAEAPEKIGTSLLFTVYMMLALGSAVCVLVRAMLVAIVGLLTSQKLFKGMLHSLLRAPMSSSQRKSVAADEVKTPLNEGPMLCSSPARDRTSCVQ